MIPKELYINFNFICLKSEDQLLIDEFNKKVSGVVIEDKTTLFLHFKKGNRVHYQESLYCREKQKIYNCGNKLLNFKKDIKLK